MPCWSIYWSMAAVPQSQWQSAVCSVQLGAKVRATQQEMTAVKLPHPASWAGPRSSYKALGAGTFSGMLQLSKRLSQRISSEITLFLIDKT